MEDNNLIDKEKYRRHSIRLKDYDYSQSGAYFVTICAKDQILSNIQGGKIKLSPIGEIALKFWSEIPCHFPNVELDQFVVMPNHIHGIIILLNGRGVQLNAPTQNYYSNISPNKNTLPVIIRTFKGAVTKWCRNNGFNYFKWQRNYFEHIIRTGKSLNRIREYIYYNLMKWEFDRENPNRIGADEFDKWLYARGRGVQSNAPTLIERNIRR